MPVPVINYDDPNDRPPELITPELTIQWIEDGKVMLVRMMVPSQEIFDRWEEWMRITLDRWPREHSVAFLYDFRVGKFAVTLYMGTKLRDINNTYGDLRSRRAIVYAYGPWSYALITAIRLLRLPEGHKREFFTDYDKAVRWLHEQITADQAALVASAAENAD